MKNIDYYNENAQIFYDRTIHADISASYEKFLSYLPEKAHILDAGCGVGRDAKYFLKQNYDVTAFDGAEAMVECAKKETSLDVLHMTFQEIAFDKKFDAVWAQASLLHVPYDDMRSVYKKIAAALKKDGIFYAAYKYGDDIMDTGERIFYL